MRVYKLAAGLAIGYVLGSRAGREKYEQIVTTARKVQDHPTVTQAQQKAKNLLGTGSGTSTGAGTDEPAASADVVVADVQETLVIAEPAPTPTPTPAPPRRRPKSAPVTPADL